MRPAKKDYLKALPALFWGDHMSDVKDCGLVLIIVFLIWAIFIAMSTAIVMFIASLFSTADAAEVQLGHDPIHGITQTVLISHEIDDHLLAVGTIQREDTELVTYTQKLTEHGPWTVHGGGGYVEASSVVGTDWAFHFTLSYRLTDHWAINAHHLSNGDSIHEFLFDRSHCACQNDGWNFIGISYRY